MSRRPDLRLRVELGPSLPGWAVRLLPGAAVMGVSMVDGALASLGATAPPGGLIGSGAVEVLLLGAAVLAAWRPTVPVGPAVVGLLGLRVLAGPDLLAAGSLGLVRLVLLLLGTHLVLRLTGLAAHTAWTGRVETAVVSRWLAPVVPIQAGVLALLAAALAVRAALGDSGGPGDGSTAGLRLVAVVAVVAAVLVAAPPEWFRRPRQ